METDLSLVTLILNASIMVKAVMALLLIVSLMSWTMIFQKARILKKARIAADEFEEKFWSGGDLNALYSQVTSGRSKQSGMAVIFESGFKEFVRLRKKESADAAAILDGAQRAMRVSLSREIDKLETSLPFLATVGSTSPYVGLFGTVWGIMNSFRSLSGLKQATLAHVAPGIAEALIATAMGLFAAIPAVISYNRYSADLERLIGRYQAFIEEFASVLNRQAHR
ncbi:MAG: protein TolQ [Gammaproteobacteria bacterium]|nr:protein TolQ [Gammaproteobacteria bacterium]